MEPRARVELATCRLRIGCSTTELPRLGEKTTLASAENCCQFYRGPRFRCGPGLQNLFLGASYREKGYMAQPIPMPNSRNNSSDHAIYFTRSSGPRRLRKPNAIENR